MPDEDERPDQRKRNAARRTLARLHDEADKLRAEIAGLRLHLLAARQEVDSAPGARLLEANQQLVLAALQAESIAEAAVTDLDRLANSSQRDPLTGTPNRNLMLDRLESAISMAHRRGTRIAVFFLDIDNFKDINDTHGHHAGDEVLQLVASRLMAVVRDSDAVSRHGGDEFLALLSELAQAGDAAMIARKMLTAIAAPGLAGGFRVELRASIGIALYPDDGTNADTLIARADAAMYCAKRGGGGNFAFHQGSAPAGADHLVPRARRLPQASD